MLRWNNQVMTRPAPPPSKRLDHLLDELCSHDSVSKTAEIQSLLKQLDEGTVCRLLLQKRSINADVSVNLSVIPLLMLRMLQHGPLETDTALLQTASLLIGQLDPGRSAEILLEIHESKSCRCLVHTNDAAVKELHDLLTQRSSALPEQASQATPFRRFAKQCAKLWDMSGYIAIHKPTQTYPTKMTQSPGIEHNEKTPLLKR